jgi:hypothetical protein
VRPPTYLCPSLSISRPNISFFPSFSSFTHEAVLAQHVAMTASSISSVPKLCDSCQRIDLSAFLPCADLEFPDASGCYSGVNKTIKTYIREPDASWRRSPLISDPSQTWYKLGLGPLEAIVARQKVCSLCHFVATMFHESYGREISNMRAVLGNEGACEVCLSQSDFGIIENRGQNLP